MNDENITQCEWITIKFYTDGSIQIDHEKLLGYLDSLMCQRHSTSQEAVLARKLKKRLDQKESMKSDHEKGEY